MFGGERIMIQSSTCSFVLPLKSSLQNQGSVTQLQLPTKRIQNFGYRNSLKNPFSERKAIIKCKFSESFQDEHVGLSIPSLILQKLITFYRFTRPYSIMGTAIGIATVSVLPLESTADLSLPFLVGFLKAFVPIILMTIYANGINQVYDVDMDKVNKPYLPLASGELSMESGKAIVSVVLLMSFTMGIMFQSPPLLSALVARFLLLSAYSVELPLLRWKKNSFLATICISIPRAFENVAVFMHIQKYVLGRPIVLTKSVVIAVASTCLFSTTFAIFKDITDINGDRDHGIKSLAMILGKEKVFWLCNGMLLAGYGFAIAIGASSSFLTSKLVTILGHCALASSLWIRATSVDLDSNASIHSLYMFFWQFLNTSIGSVTQLQLPTKRIQNFGYRNSLKNPFSERKAIIKCKFSESFQDEHVGLSIPSLILQKLITFYRFTRPYSIMGTAIGIATVSVLPLESTADLSLPFLVGFLKAFVPIILMTIYANGINQVYDVDMDKVNKPYLPLASGELSMESGKAIVSVVLLMSFTMGIMFQSPPLLSALVARFLLLSAYSVELPLLRWKKNSFLATICISIPRAFENVAVFMHIQKYVLGRPIVLTKSVVIAVASTCLFSTTFAIFKDITDINGDRDHGIKSLAMILGKEKVFWLCNGMLLAGYGFAIVIGASSSFLTSKLVTILGHCALASSLWIRATSVDLDSNASIHSLYMFFWQLFYAEYLLIPFIR